jgi:alpha-D-ribose 1-methylphosphonate 5-triphosphate synthase subunit PhnL
LLLDEPTASLDSENAPLVLAEMQRAKLAGRGILAILHDPQQIARVADREIFLSPGEKQA